MAPKVVDLLQLPGRLTRSGWVLPEGMSFSEWRRMGEALGTIERSVLWLVGDWWSAGKPWDRARVALVRDDPTWRGPSYQTCRNCARVCQALKLSRRRDSLSFAHHAEVAVLDPAEADRFLDLAEARQLSTRQLRIVVSRIRASTNGPTRNGCTVDDLKDLSASGAQFGCIYVDPPWPYINETTELATRNHYPKMSIDELCGLPVRGLAAPDSYIHLWVTSAFLVGPPERIFDAWGFNYSGSSFVMVKKRMGLGNYWRMSHEFLLTGIRGKAPKFRDNSMRSWLEVASTSRSVKPDEVRAMIERATPGPYLELFARRQSPNWTAWGNEISPTITSA